MAVETINEIKDPVIEDLAPECKNINEIRVKSDMASINESNIFII